MFPEDRKFYESYDGRTTSYSDDRGGGLKVINQQQKNGSGSSARELNKETTSSKGAVEDNG